MLNAPCYKCEERKLDKHRCHSTCEKYKQFRAEKDKQIQERALRRSKDEILFEYIRGQTK